MEERKAFKKLWEQLEKKMEPDRVHQIKSSIRLFAPIRTFYQSNLVTGAGNNHHSSLFMFNVLFIYFIQGFPIIVSTVHSAFSCWDFPSIFVDGGKFYPLLFDLFKDQSLFDTWLYIVQLYM